MGNVPREFNHQIIFLHAHSFLYALDGISKIISVMNRTDKVSSGISEIYSSFKKDFPDLIEVRNSSQHIEDRIRGMGRNGKRINLKQINNSFISGKALVLSNLNGNKFGSTLSNGSFGEVEVSIDSLKRVQTHIQKIILALKWKGPKQYFPS